MRNRFSNWLPLFLPVVVFGQLAVLAAAALSGSTATALGVFAACLLGVAASVVLIGRQEQEAGAMLRRPELRLKDTRAAGLYANLLGEALARLEVSEHEARQAVDSRTSLEARLHMLRHQFRCFEEVLRSIDDPVIIADARDRLLFANSTARKLFGSDGGSEPLELSAIPHLPDLIRQTRMRNAATDCRTAEFDLAGDGREGSYRATAQNLYDEDSKLLGVAAVLHDITAVRQEKTRHAEFVSSVCHELKTPMASIKAYVEMLMDGDVDDPAEQLELYGFIDSQVDRLTRLVNNMLNLARIESGVIKLQREDCELNRILQKSLEVVSATADEKQIRVVSELSDLYIAVHVDPDLFSQAIINLLSNAIKYTPQGGEVRLRSRMHDDEVVIEVRDNGMGIPEDSLPRLFQRFYRVPENNKAAAGTGLGLALVQYIVTSIHNGRISVTSRVNEGSCFTVSIPVGHLDKVRRRPEPALSPA